MRTFKLDIMTILVLIVFTGVVLTMVLPRLEGASIIGSVFENNARPGIERVTDLQSGRFINTSGMVEGVNKKNSESRI